MFKKLWLKELSILLFITVLLTPGYTLATPVQVTLTTELGNIQLELYPDKAPKTVKNFLNYVENEYYDGLIFHRVIQGFVIQAGGFDQALIRKEPTGDNVINESFNGLKNAKGTIAMARLQDPDSAKAQFYINVVDNWNLDPRTHQPGYTVFGKVLSGFDVAEKISKVPTQTMGRFANVPVTPVTIIKARITSDKTIENNK